MQTANTFQLSTSALSTFIDCPACFYADRKLKIARPRGIMSSLPTGIDGLLKSKLEQYRGSLPPMLERPELDGYQLYANLFHLKKLQNWKSSDLKYRDHKGNVLVGAFDDLLHNPSTDTYAMLDYKTKGSMPDLAYCEKYYQKQVDNYTLLLQSGGYKTAPFGVLFYFWPEQCESETIKFMNKTFILNADASRAIEMFDRAIDCLESDLMPPAGLVCEYCAFIGSRSRL